ncbi:hypothetical protein [Arcticibacter tournemirensis]
MANGQPSENIREWGEGPGGKRLIVWKAKPDGNNDGDGGWDTAPLPINHACMYRFSVWMKKMNSTDGSSYFGCHNAVHLDGTPEIYPYFWQGDLPVLDRWYLLVGFIHGSGDVSTVNYGGIYDGTTGAKVAECTDFKFTKSATASLLRTYLYYDYNVNDSQYFYAPRVDIVNGNEPSIQGLLNLGHNSNSYFAGKVGIQTSDPGNYELAVNGKVRAKEVRVEGGWSDFVFEKGYPLLPLSDVEMFILKNKHLPNVPSEREIARDGINLGSVNSRLLQKIEELTLYILQLNKELQKVKTENRVQQTRCQ